MDKDFQKKKKFQKFQNTGGNGKSRRKGDGHHKASQNTHNKMNSQQQQVPSAPAPAPAPPDVLQSVYKRETIYPSATPWYTGPTTRFLTSTDHEYERVLSSSYDGYVMEDSSSFPPPFHDNFLHSFKNLDEKGIFQFDITQPGGLGTKTAKTFVTRCLIGDAGTTYKYLGLRMFSIPWNDSNGDEILPEAQMIYDLNQELIAHTKNLLEERNKPARGHQYNLTLINRCYPESDVKLKSEPCFGQEKCTVSWHADSSLEHFSSIAVYHVTGASVASSSNPLTQENRSNKKRKLTPPDETGGWKIALRVWPDAEGPTAGKSSKNMNINALRAVPPISIELPNQSAYYLLDDFNHHHQHAVLAGSTHRYASTHRVARKEGHTYQWLQSRCQSILQQNSIKVQFSAKQIRIEQQMLQEIEFEWINQFYIQGRRYQQLHSWWREPMRQLVEYWVELNKRTLNALSILQLASVSSNWNKDFTDLENREKKKIMKLRKKLEAVEQESYDAISQSLHEIHAKREGWRQRAADQIFSTLPEDCRPIEPPLQEEYNRLIGIDSTIESQYKSILGQFCDGQELLTLEQEVLQWKNNYLQVPK